MRATVKFKDNGAYRQKTIEVEKSEPNAIVRKFIEITRLPKYIYVTIVKCGNRVYQWNGDANGAF